MDNRDLNLLIVKKFPKLESKYIEETNWQEGDDTGSHVIYGDVFTPYLINCIENKDKEKMKELFAYIEFLIGLEDEYINEVVTVSILLSIKHFFLENENLIDLLGKNTKILYDNLKYLT